MESQHPTFGNGKICYIELPAIDAAESALFYEKVFGWHIRRDNSGDISFDDSVMEVSGTWVTGKPAAISGLMVHLMVDNMDVSVAAVIANGGKIVQSAGMGDPEITAKFSDPAGNVLGLYQHHY